MKIDARRSSNKNLLKWHKDNTAYYYIHNRRIHLHNVLNPSRQSQTFVVPKHILELRDKKKGRRTFVEMILSCFLVIAKMIGELMEWIFMMQKTNFSHSNAVWKLSQPEKVSNQ